MWRSSIGRKRSAVGGIAGFDNDIEDQPALAGRQVELVSVLNLTTALDDDVGVRLEQTDQLIASRHRLAIEYPALVWTMTRAISGR